MSRVTEGPLAGAAAPGRNPTQPPQAPTAKVICPFCGQAKSASPDPCPRCTMEDTPATRQATKARIGPWYVLQNRSPSAPGMKFSTLLWLVHKAHVTPRSIVRGPTTYQLWRYAANVRGLSREWQLCYSCGGAIDKTSTICPHCERPQEPPPDPDTLLEAYATGPSRPAVIPDVDTIAPSPVVPAAPVVATPPVAAPPPVVVEQQVSHVERLRHSQSLARPAEPEPEVPRSVGDGRIVSGSELAAALRGPPQTSTRSRASLLNVALFFFVLIGGAAAAVLYLRPEYRAPTAQWVTSKLNMVRAPFGGGASAPSDTRPPETLAQAPLPPAPEIELPAIEPQVSKQPAGEPSPTGMPLADAAMLGLSDPQIQEQLKSRKQPEQQRSPQRPESTLAAGPTTAPVEHASGVKGSGTEPQPQLASNMQPEREQPRDKSRPATQPAGESEEDRRARVASETQSPPEPQRIVRADPPPEPQQPKSLEQAIEESRALWLHAFDAEVAQDYAAAVKFYEQIKQLPRDAWQKDLQQRLEYARKAAADQKRGQR